jgi:hypothetical protein
MSQSEWKATPAPSDLEVASVEMLQGYLVALDGILEVCGQAQREGNRWPRARCRAILADCRQLFCRRLKRLDKTYQTAWAIGLFDVLEVLWETLEPAPYTSHAELIGRVQKAHAIARMLEKMLAAMVVLESVDPVDLVEALERFHGVYESVPF